MTASLALAAGRAELEVDAANGGRIGSLRIAGREILVPGPSLPMWWGSYPMVPFAGRIRDGRFQFRGREVSLAINNPPHAIHGTTFERPWEVVATDTIAIELGRGWPFRGRVVQRFLLGPDTLEVAMELEAMEAMPAMLGWHPWFRRRLDGGPVPADAEPASAPGPGEVRLAIDPAAMYERGADGLPSGRLVAPVSPPWDDCFTGVRDDPVLEWPGVLRLRIASSLDHWVVFDELARGICVEPQSGPPNEVNLGTPRVLEAGERFAATMRWSWEELAGHER